MPGDAARSADAATILVVDDEPDALRFLVATLSDAGMTVLVAVDGLAALDVLGGASPDLVLMDAMMPGLDGFETTRRIKADVRFRHLPVVFMTGLTDSEHVVRGLEAGGVDYVTKPIVVRELLARVTVHLANARIARGGQIALDTSGRPSFAVDGGGDTRWLTPLAAGTLERLFPGWRAHDPRLPDALGAALRAFLSGDPAEGATVSVEVSDSVLACTFLGAGAGGDRLFRLAETREGDAERLLAARHGLTWREAQVLFWISRGKQNREVSAILRISPRTVNKHLEQVYEKMGVENRASATAIAVGTLSR